MMGSQTSFMMELVRNGWILDIFENRPNKISWWTELELQKKESWRWTGIFLLSSKMGRIARSKMGKLQMEQVWWKKIRSLFVMPPGIQVIVSLEFRVQAEQSSVCKWKWKWSCTVVSDSLQPRDCSLSGSSIHGILQARILEWVPFPSPGDLPNPGIEPGSPALEADALTSEPPGKPHQYIDGILI